MNLYDVWPFVAVLALALLTLGFNTPFKAVDAFASHPAHRYATIDGLRGFLAFGVFGHHAVVTHAYLVTGEWNAPPSPFYAMLGDVGVALFFAVTGFLFWGKLLEARGAIDWRKLYIGRLFRLGPVYFVAVAVLLLMVAARTHFEVRERLDSLLIHVGRWLFIGALGQPDVNGYYKTGLLMAGVTWTLRYEWLFYLSLPILALFAKRSWHAVFAFAGLAACLAAYTLKPTPHLVYAALFFCGMISASLLHEGAQIKLDGKLGLALAVLCLTVLLTSFTTVKGVIQILLVGVVFAVVSSGNSLLGLLRLKASRRLGEISYSVYLIHGLVLTGIFSIAPIREFALKGYAHHWLTIALIAPALVCLASLSYVFIERPGIKLGKKVAAANKPLIFV